ncbi:MAG: FRG domain-containing protein [Syntrophobacterales bacterium]
MYRGDRVKRIEMDIRFDRLSRASQRLSDYLETEGLEGYQDVKRRRYIQWSIIQHYEVCPTPFLDLTHSLRVACSFAFLDAEDFDPYVFVFGLPYMTNRISINSEHDIINVRLLSICPPDAFRPYYQEGYLVGTDEITNEYTDKTELDFNRRLIAKFKLNKEHFWEEGFDAIPQSALYPDGDRVKAICEQIVIYSDTEIGPEILGRFLQEWTDIENLVLSFARQRRDKVYSIREAINFLSRAEILSSDVQERLTNLRQLRNRVVHYPKELNVQDLANGFDEIANLKNKLKKLHF